MSGFYLTLPHNASGHIFPDNSLGNYKVKLPHEIQLSDKWEVGLAELHYIHSWKNFVGGSILLNDSGKIYQFHVPSGYYMSEKRLVNVINELIEYHLIGNEFEPKEPNVVLGFNDISRCASVHVKKGVNVMLDFGTSLPKVLGLPKTVFKTYESLLPIDISAGLTSFYIYCDIVQHGIVGNATAPLLRIVNVRGEDNESVLETYDNPQYKSLAKHNFDTLEIDIKNDRDQTVPFDYGKVIATLHFRLKRLS